MQYREYDEIRLKDGRQGTIVASAPDGPYSVDVVTTPETWDNVFVEASDIDCLIRRAV